MSRGTKGKESGTGELSAAERVEAEAWELAREAGLEVALRQAALGEAMKRLDVLMARARLASASRRAAWLSEARG